MMFVIIIHQITTTLQLQTTIPCGTKYLKETIGLSLTNNHLYQFLFINDTIQIIGYDYRKLIINNDKNDYKLNLIDGQMLTNGLQDLISLDVVKELLRIIRWKGSEESNDNLNNKTTNNQQHSDDKKQPIISMSMSINQYGKIHIYCLKTFDQYKYYIAEYNQEIHMDAVKPFFIVHENELIMLTISYENEGLISSFYNKQSYRINMLKIQEKHYGYNTFDWIKALTVDPSKTMIYVIDEKISELKQQELTKSFAKVFGPHTFTYGFVDDDKIYLFSNQDEKLLKFSSNFTRTEKHEDSEQKYPFKLQSYQDFFHCNRPLDPVKIDDKKQTTISTSLTTTVKQKQPSSKTTTTTIISSMKTAVTKLPIVDITTTKLNDSKTTTVPSKSKFPIIILILILIMSSILIGLIVCLKPKKYTRKIESLRRRPKHKFLSNFFNKKKSSSSLSAPNSFISPTTKTSTIEIFSPESLISKSTTMSEENF